jgi:cell division protein FtsB
MRKKYKMTSFARFLIFMIFFAPLAYIGASYYNGEDGIQKIKNLLKIESKDTPEQKVIEVNTEQKDEVIRMQAEEIAMLKQKIAELEARIEALEE